MRNIGSTRHSRRALLAFLFFLGCGLFSVLLYQPLRQVYWALSPSRSDGFSSLNQYEGRFSNFSFFHAIVFIVNKLVSWLEVMSSDNP